MEADAQNVVAPGTRDPAAGLDAPSAPACDELDTSTIRAGSMKRPYIGDQAELAARIMTSSLSSEPAPSSRDSSEASSAFSPSSIVDSYGDSPITPLDPAFEPSEETARMPAAKAGLCRADTWSHPNRLEAAALGSTLSVNQYGTSPSPSTIGPPSRPVSSITEEASSPMLSLQPPHSPQQPLNLHSIPEYAQAMQGTPRRSPVHRSASAHSLSETDAFSATSAQVTPALTRGSSIGSSRPSSFFRNSIASSLYTSPSVESLAEHKLAKTKLHHPQHVDVFDSYTSSPYSPQYAFRANQFLDASTVPEPVSPSKIGLGITTDRDEISRMPASGRQKITRSRSSSVAERIERVRSVSAASGAAFDAFQAAPFRAIGLMARVTPETTHWSLKDARDSQRVLHALDSVSSYSRLTHLDISNCNLTALPISLASLISLQELDVSQNPLLQHTLPPFLASLVSLQVLVADSCELTSLQHPLSTLSSLHTLSIRHNKLRSLPSWLCHLQPTLVNLFIDGNSFQGQWADVLRPIIVCQYVSTPMTGRFGESQSAAQDEMLGLPSLSARSTSRSPMGYSLPNSNANSPRSSQIHPNGASPIPSARDDTLTFTRSRTGSRASTQAPSRPSTSQGWNDAGHKVKKMRSVGDMMRAGASTPSGDRARSASVSPEAMFAQAAEHAQAMEDEDGRPHTATGAETAAAKKKPNGFFKKLSAVSFRGRRDSERSQAKRPHLQEDDRSSSAPTLPPKSSLEGVDDTITAVNRPRAVSSVSAMNFSTSLSHASSAVSLRSFMYTDDSPPPPLPTKSTNMSAASETDNEEYLEEIEASQTVEDPRGSLRSVLAYLRDLDDLSASDTSPAALGLALRDISRGLPGPPLQSRSVSMHSTGSALEGEGYLGDSDVARHIRTSTGATATKEQQSGHFKLKLDPAKRERVINEIVATERSYVRCLEELFDIYISPSGQPISKSSSSQGPKETVVPLSERRMVFSNAENLMQFHQSAFLPDLEKVVALLTRQRESTASDSSALGDTLRESAEDIARVFLRHGAFLKMYTIYVNNFDTAQARFQSWNKSSSSASSSSPSMGAAARLVSAGSVAAATAQPLHDTSSNGNSMTSQQKKRVRTFLKQCREHPKHSQMSCESYLLMPVQRIPRYKMLLEALLCCTPIEEGNKLFPNPVIGAALDLASNLASDLNEKKRESEGRQRLLYWQSRIGNKFKSPLVQPHRMLVKESAMTVERVVKRSSEFVSIDPLSVEPSLVQVHSLRVEVQSKAIMALLTSDILVLVNEPADGSAPVDLFTVIRLGQTTKGPRASVFGNDLTLRLVDSRAVLYLKLPSSSDSHAWAAAINAQALAF